nr:hypothetical protein [uncultured Cohaesibacter sp.]
MKGKWQKRLDDVISELKTSSAHREYDLPSIFSLVGSPSEEDLIVELTERMQRGELKAIYRVLSRETKSGIDEFQRFEQVPSEIYDENTDETFRVVPHKDIEIVYQAA